MTNPDASRHVLAVSTYGTQTKTVDGKRLSALKIGYLGMIGKVILMLLPQAQDVSSKRDKYIYIHIPKKPKLREGWLQINISAEELAQVEMLSMSQSSSQGMVVWRDEQWMFLPCQRQAEYHGAVDRYHRTPSGKPLSFQCVHTAGRSAETPPDQIIAEYSKLDLHKPAWWWMTGDTYPKRAEFKRWRCRWNRGRGAWSYVGDQLPEGLLSLLDNAEECRAIMAGMDAELAKTRYRQSSGVGETISADNADPCSLEEAEAMLGMPLEEASQATGNTYAVGRVAWTRRHLAEGIAGRTESIPVATRYEILAVDRSQDVKNPLYHIRYGDDQEAQVYEEELIPLRAYAIGDVVYAAQETVTSDGVVIATGTRGEIRQLYRFNHKLGASRGHSYDVDWNEIGVEWMFEDELSSLASPDGIRITRGSVVPGGAGQRIGDERVEMLKHLGKPQAIDAGVAEKCICESMEGAKGWLPAKYLGTWVACGVCNPEGQALPMADAKPLDEAKRPEIRVIEAGEFSQDEDVTQAIKGVVNRPVVNPMPLNQQKIQALPMAYVGELTGSISANIHCFVRHEVV